MGGGWALSSCRFIFSSCGFTFSSWGLNLYQKKTCNNSQRTHWRPQLYISGFFTSTRHCSWNFKLSDWDCCRCWHTIHKLVATELDLVWIPLSQFCLLFLFFRAVPFFLCQLVLSRWEIHFATNKLVLRSLNTLSRCKIDRKKPELHGNYLQS